MSRYLNLWDDIIPCHPAPCSYLIDEAITSILYRLQFEELIIRYLIGANYQESEIQKYTGSPSEVAMLRFAADMVDMDKLRENHEVVFEILFNSKRKWNMMITNNKMAKSRRNSSIVEGGEDEVELELMMKGAAEILIEMCSTIATKDGEKPLDDIEKQAFLVSSATICQYDNH